MAAKGFFSENWTDEDGNPNGGCVSGRGFTISWQNGPLGRGNDRKEPNGAFVEDVILAVADRIKHYQSSKFKCDDNSAALGYLAMAVDALRKRTDDREKRDVEGTHRT